MNMKCIKEIASQYLNLFLFLVSFWFMKDKEAELFGRMCHRIFVRQ